MKIVIRSVILAGMICSLMLLSACKKSPEPSTDQTNVVQEFDAVTEDNTEAAPTDDSKDIADEPKEAASDDKTGADAIDAGKQDDAVSDQDSATAESAGPVALKDLYDLIAGSASLPEMYFADAGFMLNYYGIDASKLEDYVFASCVDSTSVESVILIRVKDEASADEVVSGLNMVLEQMRAEMENYNPEANELVKAAEVRRNGKNIDLIIHKDRESILSIIDSTL